MHNLSLLSSNTHIHLLTSCDGNSNIFDGLVVMISACQMFTKCLQARETGVYVLPILEGCFELCLIVQTVDSPSESLLATRLFLGGEGME